MTPSRPPPSDLLRPRPVLVAVAPDGSDAAVGWAAALAVRSGASLHVLHVVELMRGAEVVPTGGHVLHEAVVHAREVVDGSVQVTSELAHGDVIGRVVASARTASYVVVRQAVQPDVRGRLAEVGTQVAARVAVPIVCVPRLWDGSGHPHVVTVAVKDAVTCGPLLQKAADVASVTRAALSVLHVATPDEQVEGRRVIEDRLAQVDRQPALTVVSVLVTDGDPVSELRAASRTSELLVVGRHHRHSSGGSTLGPVAEALARHSSCPVLLADPRHSVSSAEWVFQTEWA